MSRRSLLRLLRPDALFGKRTGVKDAHDRYANAEIEYLLERIEEFDGLVILSINPVKRSNELLLRRVASTVEFPPRKTRGSRPRGRT